MAVAGSAAGADLVTKAPVLAPVSLPAVDGVNGKFDGFGGALAHRGYYGGTGSLSVPVAQQFGVQFDGLLGDYRNGFVGAGGVHAFWRDPSKALFGIYASYAQLNRFGGMNVGHVAAEGALYLNRVTLEGVVGVETGNRKSVIVGNAVETFDFSTRFYDKIDLKYYVTNDVSLAIGHRFIGGNNMLALGGEWGLGSFGNSMGSAFVEGRLGERSSSSVWAGLRVYVGQKPKPLIRRHREDDPPNGLKDDTAAFGRNGSTTSLPASSGSKPPPPPPPPPA